MTGEPAGKPSGLRNPVAAVRGVAAVTLAVEALVLLMAIAPLYRLGGDRTTEALWFCGGLAVMAIVLAGTLKRRWAWPVAALLPLAVLVGGFWLHWALGVVGVLFAALWGYVLNVRRTVLGGRSGPAAFGPADSPGGSEG